jgi:hypothetical protein
LIALAHEPDSPLGTPLPSQLVDHVDDMIDPELRAPFSEIVKKGDAILLRRFQIIKKSLIYASLFLPFLIIIILLAVKLFARKQQMAFGGR